MEKEKELARELERKREEWEKEMRNKLDTLRMEKLKQLKPAPSLSTVNPSIPYIDDAMEGHSMDETNPEAKNIHHQPGAEDPFKIAIASALAQRRQESRRQEKVIVNIQKFNH
jgi:hypothetical protein